MNALAHSGRAKRGLPAQPYAEHVERVAAGAVRNAKRAGRYSPRFGAALERAAALGGEFHDLGKLDPHIQDVLKTQERGSLPIRHWDAGSAHLLACGLREPTELAYPLSAAVVYAHHIGLESLAKHRTAGAGKAFRDLTATVFGGTTKEITDLSLGAYLADHRAAVAGDYERRMDESKSTATPSPAATPMLFRLALSCLVDADHSDTARNYGDPTPWEGPALHAKTRLALLDSFVRGLSYGKSDERTADRNRVYLACRGGETAAGMIECDSPVGSGKTTAVMAHLLQAAIEKRLRRIFVVLPFTNIINQSVDVYRQALRWPREDPREVVAAHHHRVEFDDPESRQFAYLWHAPVVVTTAVQFFETLASRHPSGLRKIHQLPGSAIFIDEAHAALPAHLWPQAWQWLQELATDWGCHIVLGSGSLYRFWELEDFVKPPITLPSLIVEDVRSETLQREKERIRYLTAPQPFDLDSLAESLTGHPGPRLLIVNTVQSAGAIARHLAKSQRRSVEHLSTALCPRDREMTLERVKQRLRNRADTDWTLVATSCVEAGVDLSFRIGIRECCSLTSLLQTAGRVNRSFEHGVADVWDIRLRHDHLLRAHPAFETSARILGELFVERDALGQARVSAEYCTESLRREIRQEGPHKLVDQIARAESAADFETVEKLFRVIASDTVTVVVLPELIQLLDEGKRVTREQLIAGSVQIWSARTKEWGGREFQSWASRSTREFSAFPKLLAWTLDYDDFLGYMAGVLPLVDGLRSAFIA